MTVDVIIPTYKPDQRFFELIALLDKQTFPISHIRIINTEEKYFEKIIYGRRYEEEYRNLCVTHISRREFDHAATRSHAVAHSDADIFVMMTMDAYPKDEHLIENLVKALVPDNVAVSYARQLANPDAGMIEQFTRNYNYPDTSCMKSKEDIEKLGIKTFFCSDVCAAYKRDIFDRLGGYPDHAIFNEDMIYAHKAIMAGYSIAYAADACVYHSHNYTGVQQFHRNFDMGVSQADHPEVFASVPAEGEGISMVKKTARYLIGQKQGLQIFKLIYISGCKYLGYLLGRHYRKLPEKWILHFTADRNYWKNLYYMSTEEMTRFARQIWNSPARIRNVSTKQHRMVMRLNNIYSAGDYFFIDYSIENRTNIRFDIDQVRVKLSDKKLSKATNAQVIELNPVMTLEQAKSFKHGFRNVIVLKKMTFPNDKVLTIEMSEKQISGRNILLSIDYEDVLSADSFNAVLLEEE